jgi:hypothetical protein
MGVTMQKKSTGQSLKRLCKEFSLTREVTAPQAHARIDKIWLTLRIWPYFYFNYSFAKQFDAHLSELVAAQDIRRFKERLIELFQLHYLSAISNLDWQELSAEGDYSAHFADMSRGVQSIIRAGGNKPLDIINNALSEMRYYDVMYCWSKTSLFGSYVSHESAKSLLYSVKKAFEEQVSET